MRLSVLDKLIYNSNSLKTSIALHFFLFLVFLGVSFFNFENKQKIEQIDFELIENETLNEEEIKRATLANLSVSSNQNSTSSPQKSDSQNTKKKEAVFGLSRKALSDEASTFEVKQGNSLAKAQDNQELKDSDPDEIPSDVGNPAEEFTVSQMPVLSFQFKIPYPEEAKKKGIQGPVIMDLLIDKQGRVRKVKVLSGPGGGLDEAAKEAIVNFKFQPAKVGTDSVPVWIRYSYRFVLGD